MGKTILVSSHILPELADICNKIGIIERGQLLFDGDVQAAIRQVQQHTVLQVAVGNEETPRAVLLLEMHPDVLKVEPNEETDVVRVTLKDGVIDGGSIARAIVGEGMKLRMLKEEEVNLEDVFMSITKGITN